MAKIESLPTEIENLPTEIHDNEKVLLKLKPSRRAFWVLYLLGIILLPVMFIGLFFIIMAEIERYRLTYYITDKKILKISQFLSRNTTLVRFNKITDASMTQSFVERILRIGVVHINTAGTTLIELTLMGILNPRELQKLINEQAEKYDEKNIIVTKTDEGSGLENYKKIKQIAEELKENDDFQKAKKNEKITIVKDYLLEKNEDALFKDNYIQEIIKLTKNTKKINQILGE